MIETKYGLKFSFPHTIVHINDNSDHTIEPDVMVAEDPSLYSAIVVTGAPMGEDNRVVNITDSDILTTAYGMYSLTPSDIQKYGQSVEYANSLVAQGAPVKMLRVTPPGSTYGLSTILVQWRVDDTTKKFVVRFKAVDPEDYENKFAIYLNKYKNPARLNKAICAVYNNPDIYSEPGWDGSRVFINNISAGRGKDYNNMVTFINKTQQPRHAGDTRYEFGTIDTRSNSLVESFIASLINDSSVYQRWISGVDPVDTVNINVAKRREGSSIVIPFVNEEAIREVYEAYIAHISDLKNDPESAYYTQKKYTGLYDAIFDKLNINTFDIVYGIYIYDTGRDDVEQDLPFYQVDMFNTDIPRLSESYQINKIKGSTTITNSLVKYLNDNHLSDQIPDDATADWPSWVIENAVIDELAKNKLVGVSDESASACLGDVFLITPKYSNPYFSIVTEINQYTGNVTTKSIPKVFQIDGEGERITPTTDATQSVTIKAVYEYSPDLKSATVTNVKDFLANYRMNLADGDVVALTGTIDGSVVFELYKVVKVDDAITSVIEYDTNIFYYLDYSSFYAGETAIDNCIIRASKVTSETKPSCYTKLGTLYVNDTISNDNNVIKYVQTVEHKKDSDDGIEYEEPVFKTLHTGSADVGYCSRCKVGEVPGTLSTYGADIVGTEYDVKIFNQAASEPDGPMWIYRVAVTNVTASTFRTKISAVKIPNNYYSTDYGDALYSEAGGVHIQKGSTGFFDGDYNSVEFKWGYSALLTKAFRGQIDPRILSPVRVPAKYLFDAGFNTVVGLTQIPTIDPDIKDVIFASTIFTDDDCEDIQNNPSLLKNITAYEDIDVKQAMYDLMIERNYQRIPEAKRPVGPGSGLSLHLDSCYVDINGIKTINQSFQKRFDNPNASWDIGGYTDAENGITYTWTKRIVDNLVRHCKTYTVNKPYVNQYTAMQKSEYTAIFPDVDATDWDLRELMYQSGGNSWVADTNGVVTRRSQRTLKRDSVTSDLLQESNMRTLSQLVYLLQNKLDTYLLEYDDDGVLQTMSDECNVMFNGWVGTRVQSLSIRFERDKNIDGRDIVVCYVDVTFRGLVLSIPIIVNVNRRTES